MFEKMMLAIPSAFLTFLSLHSGSACRPEWSGAPGVLLAEMLLLEEISIVVLATSDPKKSCVNLLDNLHLTFCFMVNLCKSL